MKKRTHRFDEKNSISVRNVVISILVSILFTMIIMGYYVHLDSAKRENIIKSGKIISGRSADQFGDYLDTARDAVSVAAYTFEEMIKRGESKEELLSFLVDRTDAVTATVFENTTGLYAYADGVYLDGAGWTPDADYEPTERPWYKKALEGRGKVTIIEPYLDAQSKEMTMTIAKLLSDGESVIAMDIPMDRIQQITEEAVMSGDADMEMILDEHTDVIAHSDPAEIGKRYAEEKDDLAAELIKGMRNADREYFTFDHDSESYLAYATPIGDGWQCISVRNATRVFRPLRIIIALTILVEIGGILVLARIFLTVHKRGRIAVRLNKQLSSMADIYRSALELDIVNDLYTEIVTDERGLSEILFQEKEGAQQMLLKKVEERADAGSVEELRRFADLSTLDERIGDHRTITTEFMNKELIWLRGRFIVSQRLADGKVARVIWVVEDIDQEKKDRERLRDLSERAIAENEAKNAFLSGMSHEIRTPINAVLGMNEMILRECEDRDILSYSEDIREAGYELLDLVNSLLECAGGKCTLPRKKEEQGKDTKQRSCRESFYAPDARILAVDDNPINLKVFAGLLKKCEMCIDTATGGEQALQLAADYKYDLIFLDHMMPGIDGIETLHRIREQEKGPNRDTPVICLTANAIDGARERYIAEGFDDYLAKPVEPDKLEEMLLDFLPEEKIKEEDTEQEGTERRPERIPYYVEQIGELNIQEGIRYNGGEDAYLEMLTIFSGSAEQYADGIEESLAEADYKNAVIRIHALKSSLRIIGALDAGEFAHKMEKAAKEEDLRTLNRELESLLTRCRLIGQALSRLNEESAKEKTTKQPLDGGRRKKLLAEIRERAEECDNLDVEELLEKMQQYSLSEEDKRLLMEMKAACALYDFEKLAFLAGQKSS